MSTLAREIAPVMHALITPEFSSYCTAPTPVLSTRADMPELRVSGHRTDTVAPRPTRRARSDTSDNGDTSAVSCRRTGADRRATVSLCCDRHLLDTLSQRPPCTGRDLSPRGSCVAIRGDSTHDTIQARNRLFPTR